MPDMARDARTIATARASQTAEGQPITSGTRIFLLSPANASGIKGQRLLAPTSNCELAVRLRNGELLSARFIDSSAACISAANLNMRSVFRMLQQELRGCRSLPGRD